MGNKQILAQNNETLASILSNVLGLPSQESLKHGAYVWKKLTAQGGDFVDFVVSDSPTAYPDGGMKDGYWYEKVVEGLTPELLGLTKIEVQKVTFASNKKITAYQHQHTLGELPTFCMVFSNDVTTGSHSMILRAIFSNLAKANTGPSLQTVLTSAGNTVDTYGSAVEAEVTDTYIKFSTNNTSYYQGGKEYTFIVGV